LSSVAESDVSTSDIESDISDCTSVWSVENESKVEVIEVGCSRNSLLDDTQSDLDDLSSLSSLEDSSFSLWEVPRLSDNDDDESDSDVLCCTVYHVSTRTVYHLADTDSYMIVDMEPKC